MHNQILDGFLNLPNTSFENGMFKRKELPYGLNSIEPFIDLTTMNEHYNVHFKKYTDNLNEAIKEENISTNGSIESIKSILKDYKKYSAKVRNNGGGYYNHFLYFENISPYHREYERYASYLLKSMINKEYGSYELFKQEFTQAGLDLFGSGWVWLCTDGKKLKVQGFKNQSNPYIEKCGTPLLGCDVWEHAYYLKYQNNREKYITNWFKVINWEFISKRYEGLEK
jgi:Fe-Mn family superoxide dismutase